MRLSELQAIIRNAGGGEYALDYAEELLAKINNVAGHQVPANYWSQFTKAKEAGDFRGRVLENELGDALCVISGKEMAIKKLEDELKFLAKVSRHLHKVLADYLYCRDCQDATAIYEKWRGIRT